MFSSRTSKCSFKMFHFMMILIFFTEQNRTVSTNPQSINHLSIRHRHLQWQWPLWYLFRDIISYLHNIGGVWKPWDFLRMKKNIIFISCRMNRRPGMMMERYLDCCQICNIIFPAPSPSLFSTQEQTNVSTSGINKRFPFLFPFQMYVFVPSSLSNNKIKSRRESLRGRIKKETWNNWQGRTGTKNELKMTMLRLK